MPTSMQTNRTLIRVDQQSFQVSSSSRSNVRLPRFKSPGMFQKQLCQVIFQTLAAAMSLLPGVRPGSQSRTRLRTCKFSRTRLEYSEPRPVRDARFIKAEGGIDWVKGVPPCDGAGIVEQLSTMLQRNEAIDRNDFDYGGTSQYLMKNEGP